MLAKYNWEYRRPSPTDSAMLDCWTKSRTSMTDITPDLQKIFQSGDYNIEKEEFRQTYVCGKESVGWTTWDVGGCAAVGAPSGSSMFLPVFPAHSAVGEEQYICRNVATTCFPHLLLAGDTVHGR